MDCLADFWTTVRVSFPQVKTLLLNLDNGPENHSRRTQFMARLAAFADAFGLTIQLAYYPPYHRYRWRSHRLGRCQRSESRNTRDGLFAPREPLADANPIDGERGEEMLEMGSG